MITKSTTELKKIFHLKKHGRALAEDVFFGRCQMIFIFELSVTQIGSTTDKISKSKFHV